MRAAVERLSGGFVRAVPAMMVPLRAALTVWGGRVPPSGRVRLQELTYFFEGQVVVARLFSVHFRGELREQFVADRP